jgi:hypothetical protein
MFDDTRGHESGKRKEDSWVEVADDRWLLSLVYKYGAFYPEHRHGTIEESSSSPLGEITSFLSYKILFVLLPVLPCSSLAQRLGPASKRTPFKSIANSTLPLRALVNVLWLTHPLRYDYCPRTATLTVPHMPTPVHDAVASFVPELIDEMRSSDFLSRNERRAIRLDFGKDVSLLLSEDLPLGIYKGVKEDGTAIKQADAAIYFLNRQDPGKSSRFPGVVFEVAFSQSYGTLI